MNEKDITRLDNGEEAVEQIQNYIDTKQRVVRRAEHANIHTREQDAVYVDKLLNEVWVNVPVDDKSVADSIVMLEHGGYKCVNIATHECELIFKYEA